MNDERSTVGEPETPLNLTVRRALPGSARRLPVLQPSQLLGFIVPAVLLLSAFGRPTRFRVPAAAALAVGAISAVVTAVISNRRRCAQEAAIDERIEQSFPASDPASV